ncbi:nickel-responsive transcriptional regulator NikR [Solimonas flava]|uniref:nickel-responsive transcriptional regulator NikR n=1 Tax=Solimonas flava TaxID=415849 RepID=UPI00042688A5|nr:nickel-responsive transcriptional regulator NikR [Solimonas flava]
MERFTISLETKLADAFDELMARRGYRNRSEAVRDLLRQELERSRLEEDAGAYCVATLSYLYNHHERELSKRVVRLQHEHHDIVVSTMHAHLDHDHCVECAILRGPTAAVRRFAEQLIAEPGIRHGNFKLVTVERQSPGGHAHAHGAGDSHTHYLPSS